MTAPESPFGPVRKWGEPQWTPADMLALREEIDFQAIRDIVGDTRCTDRRVPIEPSAEERDMARLTATFPQLDEPTNTVALQTAPIAPPRWHRLRAVVIGAAGFWAGVVVAIVAVTR